MYFILNFYFNHHKQLSQSISFSCRVKHMLSGQKRKCVWRVIQCLLEGSECMVMKSMTISINWTLDLVHRESTGLWKADTRWVSRIRGIDDINQFVGRARYYILIKDKHFLSVQSHAQWITRSVYWEIKQYNLRFHVVFISRNIVLWNCCLSFMLRQFGLLWLEVRFTTIAVHGAQHAGALDLNDCDPSWAVQGECQRPIRSLRLSSWRWMSLALCLIFVVKGMARTTKGNAGFMKGRLGNAEGSWKTTQGDMWPIWLRGGSDWSGQGWDGEL